MKALKNSSHANLTVIVGDELFKRDDQNYAVGGCRSSQGVQAVAGCKAVGAFEQEVGQHQ